MSKEARRHEGEHPPQEGHEALDTAAIEQIQEMARSGEIEVPSGAEDIVAALRAALGERDDLMARFKTLAADFQNYQRRAAINEREARQGATAGVVQSVLPVMDHFDLALAQDLNRATAEQIAGGVRLIRAELMRVLEGYGVSLIEPKPGESFNPGEQQAMMQQPSVEIEPGHVVMVLGVGYRLGERVIRPAKVTVAAPSAEGESNADV
ncbi:MAG: nucleotide exchange factor GrpE [Leptolyngbya sp. PLA3]|nr:MAG: nucleotide exchange factor GrpE [Cyanobacteria bacterium CYA]MCE7968198.1 nucleotide exchange factor GrpE [Leptolyngbya sp. PL-A3]